MIPSMSAWPLRPIAFCLLLCLCTAGFPVAGIGQQAVPSHIVKVTVQVLDPASREGNLLPKATQFQEGRPVFHLTLPENDATLQVLANSLVFLHTLLFR